MLSGERKPVSCHKFSARSCLSLVTLLTDDCHLEKLDRDMDDLTPLDARESLLMDHPPRKDYGEMNKFNVTGPYEPYRDQYNPTSRHSPTGSTDRLVDSGYGLDDGHGRSLSRQSRQSHDSRGSPDGRKAATPGYGMAY